MTTAYLLDANVLIALVVSDHEHHRSATAWAADRSALALCPVVEGALVRFLVRSGERASVAVAILADIYASSRCEFWSDSLSYAETDLANVTGHRQVTDAHLAALAVSNGGRLATFDQGLSRSLPAATELIAT